MCMRVIVCMCVSVLKFGARKLIVPYSATQQDVELIPKSIFVMSRAAQVRTKSLQNIFLWLIEASSDPHSDDRFGDPPTVAGCSGESLD